MRSPSALLLVVLCVLSLTASISPAHSATDYLIVTTDALAPGFEDLVAQKSAKGLVAELVTVEGLAALSVPGRDVAEQIRTYIQTVYAQGSLRFVLLGGDTDKVPARFAFDELYPAGGTDIPSDLYYAALEGDWDQDGDGIFAEVEVDDADMTPEVCVGRVPVTSAAQAAQYSAKRAQYADSANITHLNSALLLCEVLFPSGWEPGATVIVDGATYGEELRAVTLGAAPPVGDLRLYQNYTAFTDAVELSRGSALAALNSGNHGFVVHVGHGYTTSISVGDATLTGTDLAGLTNGPHYFVAMSLSPNGAAFDDDALLEDLVLNPNGGAVAAIGWSRFSFVLSAEQTLREIFEQLYSVGVPTVGEALDAVRNSRAALVQDSGFWRYAQLSANLLGDPDLGVRGDTVTSTSPMARAGHIQNLRAAPNPFNPRVELSFELRGSVRGPVSVTIFDTAGRMVRTLWNGELGQGPHSMTWDGRDQAGVPLSSGVYFVRVASGAASQTLRAALMK